jgi:hypothetical protein
VALVEFHWPALVPVVEHDSEQPSNRNADGQEPPQSGDKCHHQDNESQGYQGEPETVSRFARRFEFGIGRHVPNCISEAQVFQDHADGGSGSPIVGLVVSFCA